MNAVEAAPAHSDFLRKAQTKQTATTNKSDEIDKIEVHIVTCQITTDKTTRAQVQTKIWDSVHALTPFQPIG